MVWIPYLVKSWAEVKKACVPGGWVFDTSAKMNRELGVETIAALPEGFVGMGAKKMPPSPGNPDVPKNMKLRVWGAIPPEKLMTRFGYLVTIMPWAEVFTALQTGVVDAVYGGSATATYDTVRDVIKVWLPYRGNFENMINIMNLKLLKSLSVEDQKIILDASKEASDAQTAKAEELEKQSTQKIKDYGIQVYEFSDAEYKALADAAAKDVWPAMQPLIGKALLDEALAYFKTLQ
jgi:TRAP-type C4-dicarboxylate transport system substrate-binding protein